MSQTSATPHPAHLAHHFETPRQQYASAKLGMWVFLVTEILLFSGLFVAYGALRALHHEAFSLASRQLDVPMGTLNTLVLIGSSLTMALAVRASQLGNARVSGRLMTATLALACAFLVVKYFEYHHKFELGLLPGRYFNPVAEVKGLPIQARNFFSCYFLLTGLHGIHVLAGMGAIGWVLRRTRRGDFS
jgi:cytochrome c oxidase subunit 3